MLECGSCLIEKGQIAIPAELRAEIGIKQGDTLLLIREKDRLLLQKAEQVGAKVKNEFRHLLKHSEATAKNFWGTKADDVWDTI